MKATLKWTALTMVTLFLSAFAPKPGGEGFEIFLDNKLLVQRFGNQINTVQSLQLDPKATGELTIKYHHCGKAGKNRVVAIKDAQNNVLKEWRFADVKDPYSSMSCSVKEILNLQKSTRSNTVKLYYTSSELPNGRVLASLVMASKSYTTP
jgi:hypothetical protein